MKIQASVGWLILLVPLLVVGGQPSADQGHGKHHDDKAQQDEPPGDPHHDPHAEHGKAVGDDGHRGHGHHHQHDKWVSPPLEYRDKRSSQWTDTAAIARGEQLYQTNCMICHGPDGRGTGPAARGLPHPPADLTNHFHMQPGDGDAYLFWRVSEGGQVEPFKSMQSTMPSFKDFLSEQQRWDVLAYVHATFHRGFKLDTFPTSVTSEGNIVALVPAGAQIVLEHGEIKGFMNAMTMGYKVHPASLLEGLQAGDHVRFTIDTRKNAIVKIERLQE